MIDISKGRYWDFGWQLISSCTRCSPGCRSCWSLAKEKRLHEGIEGKIEVHPERLARPLKRKKPAVYAIWNDLFHEDVPDMFIDEVLNVMEMARHHTHLILTKRPERMLEYLEDSPANESYTPDNRWYGLTVCNQQEADEKIPIFLQVPGRKFLSIEPLLSGINLHLSDVVDNSGSAWGVRHNFINAVILGGETGPKARPMHPDWVRSVRDQCQAAGVPFFFKSWGEYAPRIVNPPVMGGDGLEFPDKEIMTRVGKKAAGRILGGRTHDDLPWVRK